MELSTERAFLIYKDQLEIILKHVERGEFVQIERLSGDRVVSEAAQQFTGDMPKFQKQVTWLLQDACEALRDNQTIKVRITG